jgi:hypothetical protein
MQCSLLAFLLQSMIPHMQLHNMLNMTAQQKQPQQKPPVVQKLLALVLQRFVHSARQHAVRQVHWSKQLRVR